MFGYCGWGAFVGMHSRRWRGQSYTRQRGQSERLGAKAEVGTHILEVLGGTIPCILATAAPHRGGAAADDARVVNERHIEGVVE